MVRTGFLRLLWLGFLLTLIPGRLAGNPLPDEDAALQTSLAMQRAMETARHLMFSGVAGDNKKAVDVLEEQLPRVNGNGAFLRLLREAYRACIKDLWLANNGALAKRYLDRLCILEPSAAQDSSLRPPETTAKIETPKAGPLLTLPAKFFPNFALTNPKKDISASAGQAKPTTVRAKVENALDDDPFAAANMRTDNVKESMSEPARQLVSKAEEAFAGGRFAEARNLFEQADKADVGCVNPSRERWAYCILHQVVNQLNQPGTNQPPLADLERQVRGAVALAPRMDETAKWLLREIDQRQAGHAVSAGSDGSAPAGVQHLGRNKEGYQVTETRFFRIFHNQSHAQIEQVAAIAEKTRRDMFLKWFGSEGIDWTPKCELILHATGADYSRMTGESGASPGHSRIERDPSGQRIVSRRMDLRCDNPGMLDAVLPHEATHVVLAGMFDHHHVPRWADEGIAVLTEPSYKVDQHRRNLEKARQEGLLFGVQELMQLDNYPQPRRIGAFYAQSVCLVEFMTELRGPQVFTAFVRDGLRQSYDEALRKHYAMDMNELQQRWQQRLGQGNRLASRP